MQTSSNTAVRGSCAIRDQSWVEAIESLLLDQARRQDIGSSGPDALVCCGVPRARPRTLSASHWRPWRSRSVTRENHDRGLGRHPWFRQPGSDHLRAGLAHALRDGGDDVALVTSTRGNGLLKTEVVRYDALESPDDLAITTNQQSVRGRGASTTTSRSRGDSPKCSAPWTRTSCCSMPWVIRPGRCRVHSAGKASRPACVDIRPVVAVRTADDAALDGQGLWTEHPAA